MSYREEELQAAIKRHVVEDYSLEDLEEYVIDDLIDKYIRSESNIDNIIAQMEDKKIWIDAMSSGQQREK
mgnify:FL=1|jgi:hypothetical protein